VIGYREAKEDAVDGDWLDVEEPPETIEVDLRFK